MRARSAAASLDEKRAATLRRMAALVYLARIRSAHPWAWGSFPVGIARHETSRDEIRIIRIPVSSPILGAWRYRDPILRAGRGIGSHP